MNTGPHLLYIIGAPGAGKTTALQETLGHHEWYVRFQEPIAHTVHGWGATTQTVTIYEVGAYRAGGFSGTDGLAMNVQPKVLAWLAGTMPQRVVAEGDRLANRKFFDAVRAMGYTLSLAYIGLPGGQAAARRKQRAEQLGVPLQNAAWVRGRETKVHNLFRDFERFITVYDGTQEPEQIAARLREHPFFEAIRTGEVVG